MILQTGGNLYYKNTVKLLSRLIQFDTTNPPGNDAECMAFIKNILNEAGFETILTGKDEEHQNLVARLKGRGTAPPLLMYGHIDVVSTEHQEWKYPPFDGRITEGCVWGRGALDMKGAVAMMLSAIIRAKKEEFVPGGDIILCIVCDEEAEGTYGAKYMVENYPDLFKGVKYAIGEIGGFTLHMGNKKFYPIMIAEKQRCCIRAKIKGPGGHGSMPMRGGAMAGLSKILNILDKRRLPVHITSPVRKMIRSLASNMPFPANVILRQLLNPVMTDLILNLLGDNGKLFDPILHNTVNATIVRGGSKINVIPSEIVLEFDGRILPGYKLEDILNELQILLGPGVELEVTAYDKGPPEADMGLYQTLSDILKVGDGEGISIPFVASGVTDSRFFSQLGIQTYGFTPMILSKDINFSKLLHGANERVPVASLEFGTNLILELIKRF